MSQYPQNYDAFGNIIETPIADASPQDNPGLVFTPNVNPLPPGALQPGQAISTLTFQSGVAQRRIRITMNPVPQQAHYDPGQTAGSIGIIDGSQNMIWVAGDTEQGGIQFIVPDQPDQNGLVIETTQAATADLLVIDIQNSSSSATGESITVAGSGDALHAQHTSGVGFPFRMTNALRINTHFTPMEVMAGVGNVTFYTSDGTSPNGALNGNQGDICFYGPGGQPFYCSITGSNVWVGM